MASRKAVGIDLGTSNSAVAWMDASGRTAMIRNTEGDLLTPSVVLFDDAEIIVGKEAKNAVAVKPDRVAQWVKRDMGAPVFSRPIRGEYLPPEVIQACILRKLKADIIRALGPDTAVVITVPAYFDEPRRKATADAAEMAGLNLLDIVNEPTAAALAYGESLGYLAPDLSGVKTPMAVMVYDLGGGTFDATMLRLNPGDIRTLATDGDVQLGGHDWDLRLLGLVAESFKQHYGSDPRDDQAAFNRLYSSIVEAKHALSARSRVTIRVEHGGVSGEIQVTREQFEEITADLLERTAYTSRQLVLAAGLQWNDVHRVLLVGGSTRMPMVHRMLLEISQLDPARTVNPDEAVARGAAIYAAHLLAEREGGGPTAAFQVTNVNSHSLGIEGIDPETLRKTNVILIPRNTPLPATFTDRFVTKSEGQRSIVVQVLEGESSLPGECTAIGRTVIRDLPPALPKGWPIEVTFQYAANGRLSVLAVVPGTKNQTLLHVEREGALSEQGVSGWKQAVTATSGFEAFRPMLDDPQRPQAAVAALPPGQPFLPSGATPSSPVAQTLTNHVAAGQWATVGPPAAGAIGPQVPMPTGWPASTVAPVPLPVPQAQQPSPGLASSPIPAAWSGSPALPVEAYQPQVGFAGRPYDQPSPSAPTPIPDMEVASPSAVGQQGWLSNRQVRRALRIGGIVVGIVVGVAVAYLVVKRILHGPTVPKL